MLKDILLSAQHLMQRKVSACRETVLSIDLKQSKGVVANTCINSIINLLCLF